MKYNSYDSDYFDINSRLYFWFLMMFLNIKVYEFFIMYDLILPLGFFYFLFFIYLNDIIFMMYYPHIFRQKVTHPFLVYYLYTYLPNQERK